MNTVTCTAYSRPHRCGYTEPLSSPPWPKWLPPHGFTCRVALDARVGGQFRMSFTTSPAATHAFGGEYLALEPGKRIRYTDRFDDPNLPGRCRSPSPSPRCCAAPIRHRTGGYSGGHPGGDVLPRLAGVPDAARHPGWSPRSPPSDPTRGLPGGPT